MGWAINTVKVGMTHDTHRWWRWWQRDCVVIIFVQLTNRLFMDNFLMHLSSQRRRKNSYSIHIHKEFEKRYNLSDLLTFRWGKTKFTKNWANPQHKTWLVNLRMTLGCRFSDGCQPGYTWILLFVFCSYLLNNHIHVIVALN